MTDIRHGTMEELLALRDGEGSAWARSHVDGCGECAAAVYRLEQVRAQLKALPAFHPPRDRWAAIAEQVRRERRRRWMHSAMGVAAAAALAAVTFVAVRPAAPAVETDRAALDRAMLQSQTLEAALHALAPDGRVMTGAAASVAADLESRLSEVDVALGDPGAWRMQPARVVDLWQQRAGILSALVDVHATRATNASF